MLFTRQEDYALERWSHDGIEYAIAPDDDAPNPIHDFGDVYIQVTVAPRPGFGRTADVFTNGTRKSGAPLFERSTGFQDTSGNIRTLVVRSEDEETAHAAADCLSFWLPGEVYCAGWENEETGESGVVHGVYGWPSRNYVEDMFREEVAQSKSEEGD